MLATKKEEKLGQLYLDFTACQAHIGLLGFAPYSTISVKKMSPGKKKNHEWIASTLHGGTHHRRRRRGGWEDGRMDKSKQLERFRYLAKAPSTFIPFFSDRPEHFVFA